MNIYAIHGFLGLPSDWQNFDIQSLISVDPFLYSQHSLTSWAKDFNQQHLTANFSANDLLMGYSLGGRLALHALIDNPGQWKGAIIISAHTGLSSKKQCEERLTRDEWWAERFQNEKWKQVLNDWNHQAIFQQDFIFNRLETDFKKAFLSNSLRYFSLGLQKDLKRKIEELNIPILWITGENDVSYQKIADSLRFRHPLSNKIMIKGAKHRLCWSHSQEFEKKVNSFQQLLT